MEEVDPFTKANEIIDLYYSTFHAVQILHLSRSKFKVFFNRSQLPIDCARKHVEGIKKEHFEYFEGSAKLQNERFTYWNAVGEEIEKIAKGFYDHKIEFE